MPWCGPLRVRVRRRLRCGCFSVIGENAPFGKTRETQRQASWIPETISSPRERFDSRVRTDMLPVRVDSVLEERGNERKGIRRLGEERLLPGGERDIRWR